MCNVTDPPASSVKPEPAECGHHYFGCPHEGKRCCAEMSCWNYYMKFWYI